MSSIKALAIAKATGGSGGGGGDITVESLSVTQNGTYNPGSGKAYKPVTVNVPNSYGAGDEGKVVSGGALVAQTSASITANGTVDTTTNNSVTVNVQPDLETLTATENGTYTPGTGKAGFSSVVVNVSGGGGLPLGLATSAYSPDNIGLTWTNTAEEYVA